jgi:predicted nucleotidyltransferase
MSVTKINIEKAIELAKEYGATKLLLFGSALNDPENANDLDLGVEGIQGIKFFEFGGMLETFINVEVDIVDLSVDSRFVSHIKKVGKYIYDSSRSFN